MKKRLFTSALAAVMTFSSIAAMNANAYACYTNTTDNEHYKARIESLNNSEYHTPSTPELVEYMDGILSDNYAPNVKNAWRTSKSASDDGRKFFGYVIEYTYKDYIIFEFDLSDEETENAIETLKDELGYNDKLTFEKITDFNRPYIRVGFLDDNHKFNIMTAEKAYSILKEKYPVTIGQSMFDIRNFERVLMQNCITNVDEKHHMDMTEQEKKDFYDSIDHDYIKENFRATIDITNGIRIYFPDDVTEEEWLGCCNYLTQNHKATIYQHYECSSTQYTGEVDFSEISYLNGDANRDKTTTIADAAAIMQAIANPDKYALSAQGEFNADFACDGLTVDDAVAIQKKLAGIAE